MDEGDREAEFYTPRFTAVDLLSAMWLAGEIWQVLQSGPDTTAQVQPIIHENNAAFLVSGKDIAGLLDHVLILNERHPLRVLREYTTFDNERRPH